MKTFLKFASKFTTPLTVYAHCDIPCGIYDPHQAQIGALTVIRMMDLLQELETTHQKQDKEYHHSQTRAILVKEEHAELVKKEIRVIWGDYFKKEHFEKYPELTPLVHEIMQIGSKARQGMDREIGLQLLEAVNKFAEIFWKTKNLETKRVKTPYKPEAEIVMPKL